MPLRVAAMLLCVFALACTQPTASPPAQPPAAPPAAQSASQAEWDRVLQVAKQEGKVNVIGLVGDETQQALTQGFEREYGISVEYQPDPGPGIPPRVSNERGAGQYLWDVYVHGTTTALQAMLPMGAFDPLEPALIRDDIKDLKNWRGGQLEFLDEGRRVLVMTPFQRGTLYINPTMVQPDEIKSYKDLLDPKWRGKLVMNDPRRAGPGQATFTFFYQHPELGPDFIRALGRQEITILRDFVQETDAVAQGRSSILIGTADAIAEARMKQGIPLQIVDTSKLREGSDVSPANGALAIFNKAPHPNAAKLYVNWLLSKEGQTDFARASGYISARVDVPTDHALPWRVPVPGSIKTYDMRAIELREQMLPLLEEVFGPA